MVETGRALRESTHRARLCSLIMKYLVVALVVVFVGCDSKPTDPKLGAGPPASAGSGSAALAEAAPPASATPAERSAPVDTHERVQAELEQLKKRRDRALEDLEERRTRALEDLEAVRGSAREIDRRSAAAATELAQLCATMHTMDELVTKLSTPGTLTSHTEECKAIRELEQQSQTLPNRRTIDLAMEDIVDGRCGPQVMVARKDVLFLYRELHKLLGRRLSRCSSGGTGQ
jgi:hypothetical protein